MRATLPVALLTFTALTGCADSFRAPFSAQLDAPDDIEVGWGDAYNGLQDGLGALLIARFLVTNVDADGNVAPLEKIEVEISSNWGGLYILPAEAVNLVDPPELPPDVESPEDVAEYCEDENGDFTNDEEWCSWYYSTVDGQYYEFGTDYADGGGYAPNYAVLSTDKGGVVTAYLYLDALPEEGGGDGEVTSYGSVSLTASIGHDSEAFSIRSSQSN